MNFGKFLTNAISRKINLLVQKHIFLNFSRYFCFFLFVFLRKKAEHINLEMTIFDSTEYSSIKRLIKIGKYFLDFTERD